MAPELELLVEVEAEAVVAVPNTLDRDELVGVLPLTDNLAPELVLLVEVEVEVEPVVAALNTLDHDELVSEVPTIDKSAARKMASKVSELDTSPVASAQLEQAPRENAAQQQALQHWVDHSSSALHNPGVAGTQ